MIFTLHGWSFSSSVWEGTPFSSANHLELPGHGESPFLSTDLPELSAEVASLLPNGVTLVGWSLGASVALLTAALYPQKVARLVLLAPTVKFSGVSQPEAVVKRFLKRLRRNFSEGVSFFREFCSEEAPPVGEKLNPERAVRLLESFCGLDLTRYASKVKAPCFIAVGDEDRVTCLEGAYGLFRVLPKATLRVLPGADHYTLLRRLSF